MNHLTTLRQNIGLYDVPCDGCTLCCHGDAIRMLPEDDPNAYQCVPHDSMAGALMLDHKANGDCVYLGASGCNIQDSKPLICREMDCRRISESLTFTQARKLQAQGVFKVAIWTRGKTLRRIDKINALGAKVKGLLK